ARSAEAAPSTSRDLLGAIRAARAKGAARLPPAPRCRTLASNVRATGDVGARLPLTGRRSRRAWQAAAILLACGWAADRHVLPALAGRGVARALADGGYPDARFEVERVGLDRLQLRGVHLADGVDLGEVELDVGLSALWGDRPARATVRGARVALDA